MRDIARHEFEFESKKILKTGSHMYKWMVLGTMAWFAAMLLLLGVVTSALLGLQSRTECTPPDEEGGIEFCVRRQ